MGDCDRLEIAFDERSKPFDHIVETSPLPVVIKYDKNQEVDPNLIGPGFDPSQSYLLQSTHEIKRILARSVEFQSASKSFEDSGLDVTVDEYYDGWFAVFGNPSDHQSDPVVPHFRSMGMLSVSPCHKFLVSGTQTLEAMEVIKNIDGSKSLNPILIHPGSVLTKVGMYTVSLKIKVKKNIFKSKIVKKDETYLSCLDEQQKEMLISCQSSGIFYVISQHTGQVKTPVMKMEEIIQRHTFPILVKLVHGHTFEMPSSCKGTFVLLRSQQMKTAFASLLYSPQAAIIEIAADSSLRFYNFNAPKALDFEQNNNSSVFSKAFQNYSDQMPSLLQGIRFRKNGDGLASARSSSTSGHGSELSDVEEKFEWSKISVCSNSPFIESINAHKSIDNLFTHHITRHPTTLQSQLSQSKENKDKTLPKLRKQLSREKEKTTTIATAIKRTTLYDSPRANLDKIPITTHRRASADNIMVNRNRRFSEESCNSATNFNGRYQNTPTSPNSQTLPSPDIGSLSEYGSLWGDTSSVTSGESLEVEVENVTHTDISGHSQDAASTHEYKNLSSELAASVRLRTKSFKAYNIVNSDQTEESDEGEVDKTYDVLSNNPYRNTMRCSYHKLLQPLDDQEAPVSATAEVSNMQPDFGNNEEDATGYQTSGDIQQRTSINNTQNYEQPNYRIYERPCSGPYDAPHDEPREIRRTGTYEKPRVRNYDSTKTGNNAKHDMPTAGIYVTPSSENYDEPRNSAVQDNSNREDETVYETVENIYECIADVEYPYRNTKSEPYVNLQQPSDYMNTANKEDNNSDSFIKEDYENTNASSPSKPENESGLYINTPFPNESNLSNSTLQLLLSNMKDLGLTPHTQETIKSIDAQKFESCLDEETDLRSQLIDLFPGMKIIDLNKILLFLNSNINV